MGDMRENMSFDLPSVFEGFDDARKAGFLRIKKIKENGGRVAGTFCTFTPVEILDAAGITPVSLCGMSAETIPAAEAHLPKNMCPLIKSSYGFALTDKCPYTYFSDIIVGETTCDGKKKMYELLGQLKETYVLHLPQSTHIDDAAEMWTRELHRFITYLENRFDVTITDAALRSAAALRNEERKARCKLMSLQRLVPPPAYGYQIYKTLDGAGFKFSRQEVINQLDEMAGCIRSNYEAGKRPVQETAKRILITGCPIGGVLDKTVKVIEERGGVVVCFENCTGIKAATQMVDTESDDIVRAIAERYLEIGCAVMSPNNRRMEMLESLNHDYSADGVIEIDLQSCTPYIVESFSVRRHMQSLNVPYLQLETDYTNNDSGQLATRLEAFLEML